MAKRIICLILAALMTLFMMTACEKDETSLQNGSSDTVNSTDPNTASDSDTASQNDPGEPDSYAPVSGITITLDGDKITASEDNIGISIDSGTVTLRAGGDYTITGTLDDGSVIVEAPKTEKVELILAGASITNTTGAPIYVKSCDKVTITLAEGTVNTLTDGMKYNLPAGEDKPNACLYSSEDIDLEGTGALIVNGNYNNGIGSKNDIDIKSGTIEVSAPNNAIKGNDSVTVKGGVIRITGSDDGIKSDTENDPAKGFVNIEGGEIEIKADDDAIQAFSSVSITGGRISVNAAGKAVNCDGSVTLAEGILTEN